MTRGDLTMTYMTS